MPRESGCGPVAILVFKTSGRSDELRRWVRPPRALEIVIANHVATTAPLIVEGDTIVPALAAKRVVANLAVGNQLGSVFLVEADEAAIMHNLLERGRGVEQLTSDQLQAQVRFSWLYGQWVEREARNYGLPIVLARPRETLVGRIVETLQNTKAL